MCQEAHGSSSGGQIADTSCVKNKCSLLSIKWGAEKTWWFPPTTPYTRNQVPHTAAPYVLLLAAAQTHAAELVP